MGYIWGLRVVFVFKLNFGISQHARLLLPFRMVVHEWQPTESIIVRKSNNGRSISCISWSAGATSIHILNNNCSKLSNIDESMSKILKRKKAKKLVPNRCSAEP